MVTALSSVSRAKPVVTTRSGGSRPDVTTLCTSSCSDTVMLRVATVLSGLMV